MKNNRVYFEHMLGAINDIESFTAGMDFKDFGADLKTQMAAVRELEIIGEASNRVSKEIQEEFKETPWKNMLGMRNIIVHDYMAVDLDVVWNVLKNDLSTLKQALQNSLERPDLE